MEILEEDVDGTMDRRAQAVLTVCLFCARLGWTSHAGLSGNGRPLPDRLCANWPDFLHHQLLGAQIKAMDCRLIKARI